MSQFNTHNGEELSEGDRYYWRIPKGLPVGNERVSMEFILHDKTWKYEACNSFGIYLRIKINSISDDKYDCNRVLLSSVRGGIIGDDQKELASRLAYGFCKDGIGHFIVGNLIPMSELPDLMLKNKVLYIFVEMKRLNDENTPFLRQIQSHSIRKQVQVPIRRGGIPEGLSLTSTTQTGTPKVETDFKEMLLSGKNSDVTIQVKRKKFMCHRCILSARSPVFSAMMEHDMKEKASGMVTVKDAEPTPFQEFLLYLYTGNQEHLNWENLTDLYILGDKYGVEDLKNLCVKHIKENLAVANFHEFFLLSQKYNDSELKDVTVEFFLKNSKEIVGNENWMTFLSKNLVECNVLITALANK